MNSRKSSASSITNANASLTSKSLSKSIQTTSNKTSVQVKKNLDKQVNQEEKSQDDETVKARYESMMSKLSEHSIKYPSNESLANKTTIKEKNKDISNVINPAKDLDKQVNESTDEDDDNENEEVNVNRKAPNELLQEFLVYIMQKNWKDAHKLCKFILMYEPKNETAKEFLPLIEQKLEMNESDTSSEESDDDEDDDSDDDSDDDDSDDSDSETDSYSDDSDKTEDNNKKSSELNKINIKSIKTTSKLNGNHK